MANTATAFSGAPVAHKQYCAVRSTSQLMACRLFRFLVYDANIFLNSAMVPIVAVAGLDDGVPMLDYAEAKPVLDYPRPEGNLPVAGWSTMHRSCISAA